MVGVEEGFGLYKHVLSKSSRQERPVEQLHSPASVKLKKDGSREMPASTGIFSETRTVNLKNGDGMEYQIDDMVPTKKGLEICKNVLSKST